jgi:MFS family permease
LVAARHGVLSVFRDVLQGHYRLDVSQLGLLLSIGLVPSAVASIAAGWLVSRWGARRLTRVCLCGLALGGALAACGRQWGIMLVGIAVWAGCYNALFVVSQVYLTALFPESRRRVISIYLTATGVGGILFPLWAELLIHLHRGPHALDFGPLLHVPFAVLAVAMVAGALRLHRGSPDPGDHGTASAMGWRGFRRLQPGSAALLAGWMTLAVSDTLVSIWMPRVLSSYALPAWLQPGYVMAAFMAVYVFTRTSLSFVPERIGQRLLPVAPGVVGGAVFLAGLLMQDALWLAAGFLTGALFWSLQAPCLVSALSAREGRGFGWAMSLGMVGSSLVGFGAAYGMGVWGESLNEQRLWMILLLPACGYPLASALVIVGARHRRGANQC